MKNLLFLACFLLHGHITLGQTPTLYISKDQGENWEPASDGFPAEGAVNAWTTFGNTLVAGTKSHGIYLSNRNLKWYPSADFPKETQVNALLNYGNKFILAGTTGKGIYLSADEGEHWYAASSGLTNLTVRCFYAARGMLLAGTDHGLFVSRDEARSWTLVKGDLQINSMASSGDRIYAATRRGLMFSDDGSSWTFLYSDGAISKFWVDQDEIIMLDFKGHTIHSIDRGRTWLRSDVYLPDSFTFRLTPGSAKFFVAAWQGRFKMLSGKMSFGIRCYGLPGDLGFSLLLNTPFGILVSAGGGDGC